MSAEELTRRYVANEAGRLVPAPTLTEQVRALEEEADHYATALRAIAALGGEGGAIARRALDQAAAGEQGGQGEEAPRPEPVAHYVSTACQHGLHVTCRWTCKYCLEECRCSCHGPENDEGPRPEPGAATRASS